MMNDTQVLPPHSLSAVETFQVDPAVLLRKHYALQHGCFVSEQHESSLGIFAYSDVTPIPMWNHLAWTGGGEQLLQFSKCLESARTWLSGRNRRPVLYVPEPDSRQQEALDSFGFEKFDEEAWMLCTEDASSYHSDPAVRLVDDAPALRDFINVFTASFQIKEAGYARVLTQAQAAAGVRSRHFVLYDQRSRPVSAGTLISEGEFGCIYNVGTPPNQRGLGYGGRILKHLAAAAWESGCKTIFLQVENRSGARRLYEKHGFSAAFVRVGFRLREWRPESLAKTRLSALLGFKCPEGVAAQSARENRALPSEVAHYISRLNPRLAEDFYIAAWACLLHRYTGEETVAFNAWNHSRQAPAPISISIDRSNIIKNWWASPARSDASQEPAAAESLVHYHPSGALSHLESHPFPLEFHILAEAGQMEIAFRADLFSKDSIRRMGSHLAAILEYFVRNPNAALGTVEMLSPEETRQVLVEWNQPAFEISDHSVCQLFEAQVERSPDAIALVMARAGQLQPQSGRQMTYRQLNRKANRLAHRLRELGVGPEVFVGVCLDRSLDMVVALLAILKAGGACLPLDPAYPAERLSFMLQDTKAPVILAHEHLRKNLGDITHARIIPLDQSDQPDQLRKPEHEKNLSHSPPPDDAAYVIYTSGSTGQPKGVVITHLAIANHCLDCKRVYGLGPTDRVLQFSSFNFDASFEQILPALISGAALALRDDEVWNTREFADQLRALQLTVADLPTAYWHQLATEWAAQPDAIPPNALRLVIVGGEALSPDKLALWQRTTLRQRTPLKNIRLINAYGPTETTITATSFEVPSRKNGEPDFPVLPIGRPRGDRTAYVLDRHGCPAPIGVPGELYIGGSMLARGYLKRPELTATRFIPNPFSDQPRARLYRTGDLVRYLEDGNLAFLGRIDDQVKIRGFRIELGEIEACLVKHPDVRDALVLTRPDASGENRLVAYVTAPINPPGSPELRQFTRQRLPDYMVPTSFVVLEQWPLMPNGKVDRRALPEPAQETLHQTVKGPENPLELQLQLLFERVLKRAPVGVDVSFFELGGDSLQALELLVQIERATGKQLPLGALYQSSTVETLAREVLGPDAAQEWSSLVPLQTSGPRPPLILLHTTPGDILAYGNLVYRLGPDQPCYGLQSLGLKDPALSHNTVQAMAEYYIRLLQDLQPHGPYYLGGWCYGGIVAVEMARLLQNRGEKIALLALLETVAMPPRLSNVRHFLHRACCFAKMSPARWLTYFQAKARYTREAKIANKMRFRQAETALPGGPIDPRLARLEHVYNTNLAALAGCRSSYYDGTVTLFNASEKDPAVIPDPQYGWVGLARRIEVHEVPGDHDTMLTEPNVSALAQRLNDCLRRAQTSSP